MVFIYKTFNFKNLVYGHLKYNIDKFMTSTKPHLLALFQKRIEGDDALLELARLRFFKAGLGAEIYATNPDELQWLLRFKPNNSVPVVVHLPRKINLLDHKDIAEIIRFKRIPGCPQQN